MPSDVQQVVDHPGHQGGLLLDPAQPLGQLLGGHHGAAREPPLEELGQPADRGQRRPEVVRDRRQGLVARPQGRLGLGAGLREAGPLVLGALPLDGVVDRAGQRLAVHLALDEVVLGALADGADRHRLVVEAAQHDDRRARRGADQPDERARSPGCPAARGRAGPRRSRRPRAVRAPPPGDRPVRGAAQRPSKAGSSAPSSSASWIRSTSAGLSSTSRTRTTAWEIGEAVMARSSASALAFTPAGA